ncbi:hypothetical protein ASC90_07045 [Rhizobium sp. Root1220]|nr:hypothetical protein ASC90_07045 [Rhizobium sp. Root1220]
MENGAARLIVFGAGVKVDTVSRALWRAGAKLFANPQTDESGRDYTQFQCGGERDMLPRRSREGISLVNEALF